MASSGEPGDRQRVVDGVQPAQDLGVRHPAVGQHGEGALERVQRALVVDEAGRHRDHPALPHPVGEQLAVLDELAHRRQGQAEPLRDVGDGQPRAHEGLEVVHGVGSGVLAVRRSRCTGCHSRRAAAGGPGCRDGRAARRERAHVALRGHAGTSAGRDVSRIAVTPVPCVPRDHMATTSRHSCHRLAQARTRHGHLSTSRDGAARRPPAGIPRAGVNPAPHGWTTLPGPPGRHARRLAARFRTTVGTIAARNESATLARSSPAPCSACPALGAREGRRRAGPRRIPGLRRAQRRHARRHRHALPRVARLAAQDQPPLGPLRSSTRASRSSCAAPPRRPPRRTAPPRPRPTGCGAGDTLGSIAAALPHLGRRHRPRQQGLQPRPDPPRPGAARARHDEVELEELGARHLQRRASTPAPSPRPPRTTAPSWPGARCPAAARPRR